MLDQQQIFLRWTKGRERDNISTHFERNIRVYQRLVDSLSEVQSFAKNVRNTVVKKIANCKLMANRILTYELGEVRDQVLKNLLQAKQFFLQTYSGFYCTICNYENHRFFDPATKTITFSQGFCRDIVKENLPSLLFLHVDLLKLLNISARFINSCDGRGEYNVDAKTSRRLMFRGTRSVRRLLARCRYHRNTSDWYLKCKRICDEFSLVEFSPFFEPRIKKYARYSRHIRRRLRAIAGQTAGSPSTVGVFFSASKDKSDKRGSSSAGAAKGAPASTTNAAAQPAAQTTPVSTGANAGATHSINSNTASSHNKTQIYKAALLPTLSLERAIFDHVFSPFGGISSYEEGKNSLITETAYAEVATALDLLHTDPALNFVSAAGLHYANYSSLDAGTGYVDATYSLVAFSNPGVKKEALDLIQEASLNQNHNFTMNYVLRKHAYNHPANVASQDSSDGSEAKRRKLRQGGRKLKFSGILKATIGAILIGMSMLIA